MFCHCFTQGILAIDSILGEVRVTVNFIQCDWAYVRMFWYGGLK